MSKKLLIGCFIIGASFFLACQEINPDPEAKGKSEKKELLMYEDSELALLMRKMYEDNLKFRDSIINGHIPASFPEDFYNIHTAKATEPEKLNETFKALAETYIDKMKRITSAQNEMEAKSAYNDMINTCASCHNLFCPGPLSKIKKMKIPIEQ
jgi:hypothetical protein|tara:strand:- start:85037 stop:85498 length:462 start_codon:yes stop_codon:yes gene_type:complete